MATFQPADHLRSRTFIALLIAQFLAAFNDQAIHASAMFFAINTDLMLERDAITWMPVLFYAPWALFGTVAGFFADRYSKQRSLVFWKVAEIAIALLTLAGFYLGRHERPVLGPCLVLSTVFLMGLHSAFFVPAKYGAMPEILTGRMLSRGNGVLESLSFLAVILGTVVGGILSTQFRGEEEKIGLILVGLAVVGAAASTFIRRMPAANPGRPFPPYVYKPLLQNIAAMLRSRPLAVALVGIAFFTFLVAFMRATVYMHGQSQLPPWTEERTSVIVGMVALGIGVGSPLVGHLSGGKVEVGLVPLGALGMMVATTVAAVALVNVPILIACIVLVGFFTGFYLVPLFTLLQHRAPKTSKGDAVATSNVINVTGAILASGVFSLMTFLAVQTGLAPPLEVGKEEVRGKLVKVRYEHGHPQEVVLEGHPPLVASTDARPYVLIRGARKLAPGDEVVRRSFKSRDVAYYQFRPAGAEPKPIYDNSSTPRLLFLSVGALTLVVILVLWWQMPDLVARTFLWYRNLGRSRVEVGGLHHLPGSGPVLLVTDAPTTDACLHVLSATDRVTRFLLAAGPEEEPLSGLTRVLVRRNGLALLEAGQLGDQQLLEEVERRARQALARGDVVGLSLAGAGSVWAEKLLGELAGQAPVLPVHYETGRRHGRACAYIMAGPVQEAGRPAAALRAELAGLGEQFKQLQASGVSLGQALGEGH